MWTQEAMSQVHFLDLASLETRADLGKYFK